jgi:CBS domain-containing protein
MSERRVDQVMHAGVISCGPEATLDEVAAIMRGNEISAVVVVEGGFVIGVVSQTDLVNAAFVQPYMRYWRGMTVRHIMSAPVVSVRPDAPLDEALRLLRTHVIHRVVVTENVPAGERAIGILSLTDLVRAMGPVEPAAKEMS